MGTRVAIISLSTILTVAPGIGCLSHGGEMHRVSASPQIAADAFAHDLMRGDGRMAASRLVSSVSPLKPGVIDTARTYGRLAVHLSSARRQSANVFTYRIRGRGPGKKPYFVASSFTGLLTVQVAREGTQWGTTAVQVSDMKWRLIARKRKP